MLPDSPDWQQRCWRLSWWNRPRVLLFGRCAFQASKTWADKCWYIPLGIDCLPLLAWDTDDMNRFGDEDHSHLFGSTSRSLEFHRCALTREKPDWRLVWFLGHTGFQEYGYLWWCPRPAVTFLHQIFKACDDTTPPCHCSVPGSAGGTPNRHSSSRHPGDDGGFNSSFPMKDSNCLLSYFSIICASSLIRHFTLATFCSVSMVIGWPQQSLSSDVVFAELNFLVPHVNCRSQWKMVPRAVWQTLEALLEKLPLVTVTIHHCMKISPWTCLRCWGKPSLQTFCRLEQVWPIGTECFFVCSITKKTLLPVLM